MRFLTALLAVCATLAFVPCAHGGEDTISVAEVTYAAAGGIAKVPIYVRDVRGSPVGLDIPGKAIQYFQFTVRFSRPELISGCTNQTFPACKALFRPDGVLARFTHAGDPVTFVDGQSLFIRRISARTIDWTLDAEAPGDLIGYLELTMASTAAAGSELTLSFDPAADATKLGDQQLTVSETFGNGLQFGSGRVIVVNCSDPPNANNVEFDWEGVLTDCTKSSFFGCRAGETIVFRPTSTDPTVTACGTLRWDFGDDSPPQVGDAVVHTFEAGTYNVTMTAISVAGSAAVTRKITTSDPCARPPLESVQLHYLGPTSGCSDPVDKCGIGESLRFTIIGDDAITGCLTAAWDFGDGTTPVTGNSVDHAYSKAGTYGASVRIGTPGGNRIHAKAVQVVPPIDCTATVPLSAPKASMVLFHATSNVAGSTFQWTFSDSSANTADTQKSYATAGGRTWTLLVSHPSFAPCRKSGTVYVTDAVRRRSVR